jgi:uncharacterized phage protein (TIGR02218 family)
MKTNPIAANLAGPTTTTARIWKVTRRDNQVFGFTSHDQDIRFGGLVYSSTHGQTATAIDTSSGLSVDNLEIMGFLSSSVTREDLLAGRWDFADVRVMLIDWTDPDAGVLRLRRGRIGPVRNDRGKIAADLHGMMIALQQRVGETYQPGCRADLGDSRCGVNLAPFTSSFVVTSVTSRRVFSAAIGSPNPTEDNYFALGLVQWTAGANVGTRGFDVKAYTAAGGTLELYLATPFEIEVGDTGTVYRGCDKTLATCKAVFANVVNFRGEPFVPGQDSISVFGRLGT